MNTLKILGFYIVRKIKIFSNRTCMNSLDISEIVYFFLLFQHLSAFPDLFEPVVFEQNFWPGGIWQYTDKTGNDEFGLAVNSASYNNLQLVSFKGLLK